VNVPELLMLYVDGIARFTDLCPSSSS